MRIFLILMGCALAYVVVGAWYDLGSDAAIQCRALGGTPVNSVFDVTNVRCLADNRQYISLPNS